MIGISNPLQALHVKFADGSTRLAISDHRLAGCAVFFACDKYESASISENVES